MSPPFFELCIALRPALALTMGAIIVIGVDMTWGSNRTIAQRLHTAVALGLVGITASFYAVISEGQPGSLFGGTFMLDALGHMTRLGVLGLSFFTLALAPSGSRLRNPAEYVALILLGSAGFTLMAVAQQLLVIFLAIELASLSLYLLAGFDKTRPESAEAALNYFLFGGMAAAFLLYGLTGSIELPQIAIVLSGSDPPQLLMLVALIMVIVAFGFKSAAAPFHLWAPDVYQGAPAPSAALIASASKLAGVTVFARLLWPGLGPVAGGVETPSNFSGWLPAVALVATASLLLGNISALAQNNFRRFLAYSAIAHAGIMLLGVMVIDHAGYGPVVYYTVTYGLATVGTFGVIGILDCAGVGPRYSDLAGLYQRCPILAATLLVCLLSLAGIPPLAGFFGKFGIFVAAFQSGGAFSSLGGLAILGIAASAVALYYYLIVLKQVVVTPPPGLTSSEAIPVTLGARIVVASSSGWASSRP